MFGKSKGEPEVNDQDAPFQFQRLAAIDSTASVSPGTSTAPEAATSSISSAITIAGRIDCDGTLKVFGRIKGELQASVVLITDYAQVEGDIVAEELTIDGRVKGTIRANRVKLNKSAVVEANISHRLLSIEEGARFAGSARPLDDDIDVTSRVQVRRPQLQIAASENDSQV
jgi:cytoskeletal protein CcmA (bactofilin family)